ncbi:MAG: phosphatase domain-containing protein [Brevirhabdus sp.]
MLSQLQSSFKRVERTLRNAFGKDISTPGQRLAAHIHMAIFDHSFFRVPWWNLEEIAPGVWRSNQPGPRRVKRYKGMGIKTIVNLRGATPWSFYLFEKQACEDHGITLVNAQIYAKQAARRHELIHLVDVLKNVEAPFLMHCKSGSDRAGMASILWLMMVKGQSLASARRHLNFWPHLHVRASKAGIVDHFFDVWEARNAQSPISIEEWIRTEYDTEEMAASFKASRGKA